MPLSQADKDKIVEEETLRFEARMKAHEKQGMKGGRCGVCGQASGCRGCRIWGWVFGGILLLCLFRFFGMHDGYYRHDGQRFEAPSSDELGQGAPAKQGVK